ncbi:MAG: tRNA pseudouridine(38-40) synthase TruA [Candidatus Omnitrophica bacterium]|nr:tRNA pseudouridine(38-40) synthase TruA [Candidatus Omnitrophota bacterium]
MTRTFKFTVAYDGSRYAGWQRQKNTKTIQSVLEETLQRITGRRAHAVGASRTDSGVHAEGQTAHVQLQTRLSPSTLQRAMNALLPEDILIRKVELAPRSFHARYQAKRKWYRYLIWNEKTRPLFERNRVLHLPGPLDLQAMRRTARKLTGRRDFRPFCSASDGRNHPGSALRTIRKLSVRREADLVLIDAEADGFLYHMVRRIVGLLIQVGQGKRALIPPTAPARGLCLMRVSYR